MGALFRFEVWANDFAGIDPTASRRLVGLCSLRKPFQLFEPFVARRHVTSRWRNKLAGQVGVTKVDCVTLERSPIG